MTYTRFFADRRRGRDRRDVPRRGVVSSAGTERRRVVDRRRGAERRSTLDRRGHGRRSSEETPAEHVRNALQLLRHMEAGDPEASPVLLVAAAMKRLERSLELLEPISSTRRLAAQPPAR